MREMLQHYINGQWVNSQGGRRHEVINPATEAPCAAITLGTAADVEAAVAAAKAAGPAFAATSKAERLALLGKILAAYMPRAADMAKTISEEMGCPISVATAYQAALGAGHLQSTMAALEAFHFEEANGTHQLVYEPIGVVGLITPWNWPLNQIVAKVAPALAAGCTMVLKPSEVAPGNAYIFAEIMHAAGVPPGVFNLVNGDGPGVGEALSRHPDVAMMSFTGSTRAGVAVAKAAADTVKRVHQELGGKSPSIILDDADLQAAVIGNMQSLLVNSGQSCNAPTRMLVPASLHDAAVAIAKAVVDQAQLGDPAKEGMHLGPVANVNQFSKIQGLIAQGVQEGATLAAGGPGRPEGMDKGYFVRPTVFANVTNSMAVAREEIFGPVLAILPYQDEAEAIRIANDTPYGLAAYIWTKDPARAARVARQLKAGNVHLNGANIDLGSPFGGYKQSGNGREFGRFGLEEFLEVKAVLGQVA
jgi:aldehyde dehydrogenase (NAD+)